jgi:hypothetical protein
MYISTIFVISQNKLNNNVSIHLDLKTKYYMESIIQKWKYYNNFLN